MLPLTENQIKISNEYFNLRINQEEELKKFKNSQDKIKKEIKDKLKGKRYISTQLIDNCIKISKYVRAKGNDVDSIFNTIVNSLEQNSNKNKYMRNEELIREYITTILNCKLEMLDIKQQLKIEFNKFKRTHRDEVDYDILNLLYKDNVNSVEYYNKHEISAEEFKATKEIEDYISARITMERELAEFKQLTETKKKSSIHDLKQYNLNFQYVDKLRVAYEKIYKDKVCELSTRELVDDVCEFLIYHFKTNSRYSYTKTNYIENINWVKSYLLIHYDITFDVQKFKETQKTKLKILEDNIINNGGCLETVTNMYDILVKQKINDISSYVTFISSAIKESNELIFDKSPLELIEKSERPSENQKIRTSYKEIDNSLSNGYVYFLTQDSKFKIGVSKIPYSRKKTLEKTWGEFDSRSHYYKLDNEYVRKVERAFHKIFQNHNMNFICKKDGFSEFFDISILDECVKYMDLMSFVIDIERGEFK